MKNSSHPKDVALSRQGWLFNGLALQEVPWSSQRKCASDGALNVSFGCLAMINLMLGKNKSQGVVRFKHIEHIPVGQGPAQSCRRRLEG